MAPDPASAATLSRTRITEALRRARRHHARSRAEQIHAVLQGEQLTQPAQLVAAYAAVVRATAGVIGAFNSEITSLQDSHVTATVHLLKEGLANYGLAVELAFHAPRLSAEQAKTVMDKTHTICPYSKATATSRSGCASREAVARS